MKKIKKKFSLKKWLKGFTLVELLAVIVILAVIMIIAIPSILNTMTQAKKKSFYNFCLKLDKQVQEKYMEDSITKGFLLGTDETIIIYDIKELGITSVGDYRGSVAININKAADSSEHEVYTSIAVYDHDYFYRYDGFTDDYKMDISQLHKVSEAEEMIKPYEPEFKLYNIDYKNVMKHYLQNRTCLEVGEKLIDGATGNVMVDLPRTRPALQL